MVWWNKTNKNLVGWGNSQNLNQRFSLTSHTRKGDLQERPQNNRHSLHLALPTREDCSQGRPQNNRHSLHLASPARGGDLHRKSVGFKTLTIACLALALISTISLNIIRTYSINNTRTNALGDSNLGSSSATTSQGSAATLANDPNYISISLSNATGSSELTSGNISITTPTGGGIATGSHTITIHTSSIVSGYNVTLHSSGGDTDLVPSDFGTSESSNNNLIEPAGGSTNPAPLANPTTLANNQWGVALPGSTLYPNKYSNTNDYTSTNQTTLANTKYAAIPGKGSSDDQDSTILTKNSPANQATGDSTTIYYGVKVSPSIQADTYSAEVTYTATATIPTPTLTRLLINDSVQQNQTSEFAIEGTNLDTVSSIKLCPTGQQPDTTNANCYEVPSKDIDTYLDDTTTSTKGTILSFTNPAISEPGTYDLYTISPVGQTKLDQPFIVQEQSTCRNGDPNSDCQVDIDGNMIPIAYDEADQQWNIVTDNDLTTTSSWYDYTNKQWANAVTLRDDYEAGAVCVSVNLTPPPGYMFSVRDIHSADYDDISKIIRPETLNPEVDFGMVGFRGDTRILDVVVSLDGSCATNRETLRYTPLAYARMAKAGMTLGEGINDNTYQVNFNGSQYDDLFNDSILGYWVYIPRYAYEVQRPNAIDRVVTDEYPLPDNKVTNKYNSHSIRNEFSIHFEKATDTKKTPAETCNILNPTKEQMWANGTPTSQAGPDNTNILAKDYRTDCAAPGNANNISRLYTDANTAANNTTWATHPAFTFGSTELNGLWIGKFETTGTVTNPTVKPNQHANVYEYIGEFYTMARSIGTGTYDPANNGGNTISGIAQNSHNLSTATSHMLKNSEWGAITYLASSKYGAGTNNVSINSAYPSKSADADIANPSSSYKYGITGCGPNNINRSTTTYSSVTTSTGETVNLPELSSSHIEDPLACGDVDHSYIGNIGQLASTTNNVYGIYDMSGGASEYVMGNLTGYDDQSESSSTGYTENPIKPLYVDLYKESPYGNFTSGLSGTTNNPVTWSNTSSESLWNNDVCTWGACGGHALHETKQYQSVSGTGQSWDDDNSGFVYSSGRWFQRGGNAGRGSGAGLFYSGVFDGYSYAYLGFRSVLLAAP